MVASIAVSKEVLAFPCESGKSRKGTRVGLKAKRYRQKGAIQRVEVRKERLRCRGEAVPGQYKYEFGVIQCDSL